MPSLFVNCPTVICSPNMLLSYGRDTSSELWTPVLFFTSHTIYCNTCFTVFLQTIIFHTIRLILCYSKPVRLTTSLFRWGKVLGLCCAGSTLAPESLVLRRITFRDHQPSTCFLAPTGSIKPWFLSEGKLATVRIIPSSWGSQRTCELHAIKLFFWRRCRGDQDTLQGESPLLNLFTLFLSCFILFTTLFAALNQNTKKLVASFTLFTVLFAFFTLKTQKN